MIKHNKGKCRVYWSLYLPGSVYYNIMVAEIYSFQGVPLYDHTVNICLYTVLNSMLLVFLKI